MNDYIIRRLEENDLREFRFISEIHESMPKAWVDNYIIDYEGIEKSVSRLIERHKTSDILCCVAKDNSQIIAFIWAEINDEDNEVLDIISLWTNKNYRGQGIATKLKIELERWAKAETNAKKISTTVNANNKSMVLLNQKLGYEINYYRMTKII